MSKNKVDAKGKTKATSYVGVHLYGDFSNLGEIKGSPQYSWKMLDELLEWGYTFEDTIPLTVTGGIPEIQGLLEALRTYAIKPSDPLWKQLDIDARYPPEKRVLASGDKMQFCNTCGGPIVLVNEARLEGV